jgi:predicted amidohydrolase YtcJ
LKFVNGRFHTMRFDGDIADSLEIVGESITGVDSEQDGIDLKGRTVLPGFCDAHAHFYYWARTLDDVQLDGVASLRGCLSQLKKRVRATSPGTWMLGRGYNKNLWSPPDFPSKADLDLIAPLHPVAVFSKDEHSMWVNSAALMQAGITRDTPDPSGGVIKRDALGEPTGILLETAYELVTGAIPPPDPSKSSDLLTHGAGLLHRLGVTSMHDMGTLDAWHAFNTWEEPSLDLVHYFRVEFADFVEKEKLKSGMGTPLLRVGGLKMFMDGALGSQTAYMWEPYEGGTGGTGVSRINPKELLAYLDFAAKHKLACAIHAIGDRANSDVIDAAQLHKARDVRHRIEHAQIVRPDDVPALAASGWTASMQPSHLVSDRDMALRNWGEPRSRYAYPIGEMLEAKVPLAFGSDVPIEPVDPLFGIYAACQRMKPGDKRGPWESAQCIDRYAAVWAFTAGGARATGQEAHVGTLAPGMRANLVILDRDLLEVPDDELADIRVVATIHAGKPVFVDLTMAPDLAETLTSSAV